MTFFTTDNFLYFYFFSFLVINPFFSLFSVSDCLIYSITLLKLTSHLWMTYLLAYLQGSSSKTRRFRKVHVSGIEDRRGSAVPGYFSLICVRKFNQYSCNTKTV